MIISNSYKFAFSRMHGCGDAAFELLLRDKVLKDGDVATSMPFFNKDSIGTNDYGLGPFATPSELKKALGPDFKVLSIERDPFEAIYSEYLLKTYCGIEECSFNEFVLRLKFKYRVNSDSDYSLKYSDLFKDLKAFLKKCGVDVSFPARAKFDEFENINMDRCVYVFEHLYTDEMANVVRETLGLKKDDNGTTDEKETEDEVVSKVENESSSETKEASEGSAEEEAPSTEEVKSEEEAPSTEEKPKEEKVDAFKKANSTRSNTTYKSRRKTQ